MLKVTSICTVQEFRAIAKVQHVPGSITEGAAMATLADGSVTLWTLRGQRFAVLEEPNGGSITCFNLSPEDGGWLSAGGNTEVSIWPMRNGRVLQGDSWEPSDMFKPPPVVQYKVTDGVRDVAMDPRGNKFIIVSRMDNVSVMINVLPDSGAHAVEEEGPGRKLLVRGKEQVVVSMKHWGVVNAIAVNMDEYVDEPRLLTALEDGNLTCWDLEGNDIGQRVAELRSLTAWELFVPMAVVVTTFFQVTVFAFGPSTSWEEEIERPATKVYKIVLLDFDLALGLSPTEFFFSTSVSVIVQMVLFVFCSMFGLPQWIAQRKYKVRSQPSFLKEVDSKKFGAAHACHKFLSVMETVIQSLMALCATFLPVLTFRTCANFYDCIERPEGFVVTAAPEVRCLEGVHLALVIVVLPIGLLYSVLLIPHAVVQGDTNFVVYTELFKPRVWQESAERYSTLIFQGLVHPYKQHAFWHPLADLCVKISIPCISILTNQMPITQMIILSAIVGAHFVMSVIWLQFIDRSISALVQGIRLLTLCAMIGALLTVASDDKSKATSFLVMSSCLVSVGTTARIVRIKYCELNDDGPMLRGTSTAKEARINCRHKSLGNIVHSSASALSGFVRGNSPRSNQTSRGGVSSAASVTSKGSSVEVISNCTKDEMPSRHSSLSGVFWSPPAAVHDVPPPSGDQHILFAATHPDVPESLA